MTSSTNNANTLGIAAACWGLAGFVAIIAKALVTLSAISIDALRHGMTSIQWSLLWVNIIFMAYSEGYKGFHQSYSPRLAARVKHLTTSNNTLEWILAPVFCMGFFNAPKKRIVTSVVLLVAVVTLVALFRLLPQPWRGILDAGVVVGLTIGLLSTLWFCFREFIDPAYEGDPEVTART